jgi:hypothetical protein
MTPKPPLLAIAAPVRGEATYLLEWIAYYRVHGIKAFLLADNGGSDETSALLKQLEVAGIVLRFDPRDQRSFQMLFYGQAQAGSEAATAVWLHAKRGDLAASERFNIACKV